MPHITTAMHRSVRRGVGDIFVDSLLGKRDIVGEVKNVKDSFSSWDKCMDATYCKWPVIIGIIIGGLILLSIITCIVRCACCGMSCCCSCFSFLKCCDCCGDSCAGKKNKPMKHLDSPFGANANPHQGYQAPAPMMGGALPAGTPMNVAASKPAPPQYAQFEVGKNGLYVEPKVVPLNEDALPPMPSWDAASKKHVLTEDGKNAVELGELDPATGQQMPLMSGAAATGISNPPSPGDMQASPFGARPGQGVNGNGYMGVPGDNYAQNQTAYNANGRHGSPAPGMGGRGGYGGNQNYDGQGRGFGPASPQDSYDQNTQDYNGQGRGYGSPQDQYDQNNGFTGAAAGPGYGRRQPQRQYSNDQYSNDNRQFAPPARQYSSDSTHPMNPGRQYSDRSYPNDNFQQNSPPPRGPSRGPGGPIRQASPALNNNSGFDFGGGSQPYQSRPSPPPQQYSSRQSPAPQQGYGRPPPQSNNSGYFDGASTAAPSYSSRSPPPQEPAYPGYKPYQPGNQGRGTPQALSPGAGRGREPQRWDPVQQ